MIPQGIALNANVSLSSIELFGVTICGRVDGNNSNVSGCGSMMYSTPVYCVDCSVVSISTCMVNNLSFDELVLLNRNLPLSIGIVMNTTPEMIALE